MFLLFGAHCLPGPQVASGVQHMIRRSPLQSVPGATSVIARAICARLREAGLATEPLLREAGLRPEQISNPQDRVASSAQIKLLRIAADVLRDDFLGFHLACGLELRDVGLIYYILSSSNGFAEAFQDAKRYSRLVDEGVEINLDADRAIITLNYTDARTSSDRQHVELWLFSVLRMCRQLTDTRIAPRELTVGHFREATPREFREYLGCEMKFAAGADTILLPKSTISLPFVHSDRHLHELLVGYAEEALQHQPSTDANFRLKVERAIAPLLPHGRAKALTVARELGLSRRSLARSLAREGLSFTAVLDQYRANLFKSYLAHEHLSISHIAWLLGFQEVASLTHASKRWFDKTPRQLRAQFRGRVS
jgi:AraC-like DNA-binding protein